MELTVGAIVEGKVKTITSFGAFIALPEGKTGMVHISEVANTYVSDIRQFLTEGQDVKVPPERSTFPSSVWSQNPSVPRDALTGTARAAVPPEAGRTAAVGPATGPVLPAPPPRRPRLPWASPETRALRKSSSSL